MPESDTTALDRVYAAMTTDELREGYAAWAETYDRDTLTLGYHLPFTIAAWVARHVPVDAEPILDAGTGTGLTGLALHMLGYRTIEGLDLSNDMLALAAQRSIYRKLEQAELGKRLPWDDGHFAAFVSSGVFTVGHAPASSFEDLLRITRPGGHAIFMIRASFFDGEFGEAMKDLERDGRWSLVEASEPFRSFIIAEPEAISRCYVYKVL